MGRMDEEDPIVAVDPSVTEPEEFDRRVDCVEGVSSACNCVLKLKVVGWKLYT